ncbi:MAG: thrombospondin type 3 repeat-containing protein [Planctomycetota bacterium]|jgi:hypothetical protein
MRASRCFAALVCVGLAASVARAGDWPVNGSIAVGGGTAVAASSDGYYGLLTLRYSGTSLVAERTDPVAAAVWGGVTLTTGLDTAGVQVIGSATDDGMRGGYFAWAETPSATQEVHVARVTALGGSALFGAVSRAGKDCHSPRLLKMASGVLVAYVNDTDGVQSNDPRTAGVIELALVADDGTVIKRAQLMAMHPDGQLQLIRDGSGGASIVWDVPPFVNSGLPMPAASATWAVRVDEDLVSVWERIDDDPLYARRGETAAVASDGAGGLWVAGRKSIGDAGTYSIADNGEFVMVNHLLSDGNYDWAPWVKALEWDAHEKRDYNVEPSPGVFYPASDTVFADYQTDQHSPRLVADGSGGVYVLAQDNRMHAALPAEDHLYAQHITSKGQLQWDANQTGGYFSGTITPVATPIPVYNKDYGWMEGAEVRNNGFPKQQHSADSASWWGYDTFEGNVLNAPFVSVWAEDTGGSWDINAVELDPDGGMQANADATWGSAPISIATGLAASPEIFTVVHERFGTYIVWTEAGNVRAAHFNFFEMWDLWRVNNAVGPGPDLFSPGPVTNLQAVPQPGWVDLSWLNPSAVNANKPFNDFDGVMIVRTTDGPALSPYDFPEDAWRDAGPAEAYADYSVEAGVTYYYTAFAYDTEFAQLNFSTPVWTSVRVPLGDVDDFQALGAGPNAIRLSWTNPSAADYAGLEIWRDDTVYPTAPYYAGPPPVPPVPGTATLVGRVLVTDPVPDSLMDTGLTPNTKYYYTAFPLDDPVGDPLATFGARDVAATVGGVSLFTATGRNGAVDLTWENPTVGPAAPDTFDGIVICRAEGSVAPTSPDDGPLTVLPIAGAIGQPGAHPDSGLTNGTEYAYAAFAAYTFDGDRVYAVPGASSAIPVDLDAPDPITNFTADNQALPYCIYLSWDPPDLSLDRNKDLWGLVITRKLGGYPTNPDDGVIVVFETLDSPGVGPLSSQWVDLGTDEDPLVIDGDPYYYAAWTFDAQLPPNLSVVAEATPPLPAVSDLEPEIIQGPTSAADDDSATIEWTARDFEGDMTGIVRWGLDATGDLPGHEIRWTTGASVSCPDSQQVTFDITGLKSGATYVYEVTVTDSAGQAVTAQGVPFTTSAPAVDTDGDGLPDAWENQYHDGTDPSDFWLLFDNANSDGDSDDDDDLEDFDGDGLWNMLEYWFGSDPHSADGDGDGISDIDEVMNGTDPGVSMWAGGHGAPLSEGDGCGSGGHAPLAWALVLTATFLALRRRRTAEAR